MAAKDMDWSNDMGIQTSEGANDENIMEKLRQSINARLKSVSALSSFRV
jgi:hypothetical protein